MGYPVFASGDVLTATDMNAVGLWKVATVSFTSQTTGILDNVFSSNYDHYKIVISTTATTNAVAPFVFRTNGVDNNNNSYFYAGYYINISGAPALTAENSSGATTAGRWGAYTTNGQSFAEITVSMPYSNTQKTTYISTHQNAETYARSMNGYFDNTTRFDGIKIYGSTLTGAMTVYGYRK